jgi:copper chaperone
MRVSGAIMRESRPMKRFPNTTWGYNAPATRERSLDVSETMTYSVPKIHCAHCAESIKEEISEVQGVDTVDVDVDTKVVTISGEALADDALRAAIREAGYEAA